MKQIIIGSFLCLGPFSMPGDATVIKGDKNTSCHGDYVGGRAEIIQIVIMWCPETRWRKRQRRWEGSTVSYQNCQLWMSKAMGTELQPLGLATRWWLWPCKAVLTERLSCHNGFKRKRKHKLRTTNINKLCYGVFLWREEKWAINGEKIKVKRSSY